MKTPGIREIPVWDTTTWALDQIKSPARIFHTVRATWFKNYHKFKNKIRINHRIRKWRAPSTMVHRVAKKVSDFFEQNFFSDFYTLSHLKVLNLRNDYFGGLTFELIRQLNGLYSLWLQIDPKFRFQLGYFGSLRVRVILTRKVDFGNGSATMAIFASSTFTPNLIFVTIQSHTFMVEKWLNFREKESWLCTKSRFNCVFNKSFSRRFDYKLTTRKRIIIINNHLIW